MLNESKNKKVHLVEVTQVTSVSVLKEYVSLLRAHSR